VYFSVDGSGSKHPTAQQAAAASARADLHDWPADRSATVPTATILRGHPSVVLAGTVSGDPSGCTAGEQVSTPVAKVGDCWLALTDPPAPSPAAKPGPSTAAALDDTGTRFAEISCNARHTHEVYWAEALDPQTYLAAGGPGEQAASAWAKQRAADVCGKRQSAVSLAHDVTGKDILLEYQWPSALTWPPTATSSWTRAQVVCLAQWKDGKPSDRHLLHR
jgi:hypothetical protein